MEHMIAAPIAHRPLEREHVEGLLDHAEERGIAPRISTDLAGVLGGDVETGGAKDDRLAHPDDGFSELLAVLHGLPQEVEGETKVSTAVRRPQPFCRKPVILK